MLAKKHEESPEIHSKLKHLLDQWNSLLQEVANRGRGLEEAHDILEFNNQVEKVEAWIRDKVCDIFFFSQSDTCFTKRYDFYGGFHCRRI